MLQHLTSGSMASLSNNFKSPRSFEWELDSTAFCFVLRVSLDRASKILSIPTFSSLDHPPPPPKKKFVYDDVQVCNLLAWVLFDKLPPRWLVLLCILRVLLRAIVQPWTGHFHSQHLQACCKLHDGSAVAKLRPFPSSSANLYASFTKEENPYSMLSLEK